MTKFTSVLFLIAFFICNVNVSAADPVSAQIIIHADQPGATINRDIYGQFTEHLGGCVYGGIWVGEDSKIPNTRGIRNDVVAALKNLNVPIVRWPGGCFADEYHWRDGIGPRNQRPKTINSHWGGVIETNAFGTHEFMDFCQQIGAEPYLAVNVGSGTVQEMMDWIEYMTSDSDSTLADLRRQNGRKNPWHIKYIGVGNESWGCGGNMTPEFYADNFRRYNEFVKNYGGNHLIRIACGPSGGDFNWTDVLMRKVGTRMNGLSMHNYTLPTGSWDHKGPALGFSETQWASVMQSALGMNDLIVKHSAIMDQYDPRKHVGLMVDEWGNWYDPAPDDHHLGLLGQQNTLRDALSAAAILNIFQQHADRVKMACIAQMVNVLQSVILTDGDKMILTPTYWIFDMYKPNQDAKSLPLEISSPMYHLGRQSMPAISASASRDSTGKIYISLVNLDPDHSANLSTTIEGTAFKRASSQILTANTMDAHNTFDNPDAIKPALFNAVQLQRNMVNANLPAKSVVVIELQ